MILVDTNVLVALASPRDRLHARAASDLEKLARGRRRFGVTAAVLTEAALALPRRYERARLGAILREFDVQPVTEPSASMQAIFAWLDRYHEHEPDWADAQLAVLSGLDRTTRIWTYDREFTTIWRRPDGTRIPLAMKR
jgi:predicted nucleic acid-binding protein